MGCPNCKRSNLVEIALTVAQRKVTMRSCSRCDSRWWHKDGEAVRLPSLLELASQA